MNEVKLGGKIAFKEEKPTKTGKTITTFALGYNGGKDEDGNKVYGSKRVKIFEAIDFKNGDYVNVEGYFSVNKYEDKLYESIIAKSITLQDKIVEKPSEAPKKKDVLDDDIPFWGINDKELSAE